MRGREGGRGGEHERRKEGGRGGERERGEKRERGSERVRAISSSFLYETLETGEACGLVWRASLSEALGSFPGPGTQSV